MMNYDKIKFFYDNHLWNKVAVAKAVQRGRITAAEYEQITGQAYSERDTYTITEYAEAARVLLEGDNK